MRFVMTAAGFIVFIRKFILNAYIILLIIYVISPYDLIPEVIYKYPFSLF